jgi:hypothetical protein
MTEEWVSAREQALELTTGSMAGPGQPARELPAEDVIPFTGAATRPFVVEYVRSNQARQALRPQLVESGATRGITKE